MKSVTQRIKEINQPTGGYINPKLFEIITFEDDKILYEEENINSGLVGTVVDYMTRYLNSGDIEEAFKISLLGANKINESKKAYKLLENINGLTNKSIINACKLCGYDVCYRAGTEYFKNVDEINPDEKTIFNIQTMIRRSISFFDEYGPIIKDGITFRGGYTSIISSGDADFITKDTLWDFKVSKNELTKNHTLQLMIYYLLGLHSYECDFSNIKKIGIFNPRKNVIYQYEIQNISNEIIEKIESEVIGYNSTKKNSICNDILTVKEVMSQLGCSRHVVMKFYSEYNLPLRKEKNKYVITKEDFLEWIEEMQRLKEEQERQQVIFVIIFMILSLLCLIFIIFKIW